MFKWLSCEIPENAEIFLVLHGFSSTQLQYLWLGIWFKFCHSMNMICQSCDCIGSFLDMFLLKLSPLKVLWFPSGTLTNLKALLRLPWVCFADRFYWRIIFTSSSAGLESSCKCLERWQPWMPTISPSPIIYEVRYSYKIHLNLDNSTRKCSADSSLSWTWKLTQNHISNNFENELNLTLTLSSLISVDVRAVSVFSQRQYNKVLTYFLAFSSISVSLK